MNKVLSYEEILESVYLKEKTWMMIDYITEHETKILLEELLIDENASDSIKEASNTLKELTEKLKNSFAKLKTSTKDLFKTVLKTIKDLIKAPKQTVLNLIESIKRRIKILQKNPIKNIDQVEFKSFITLLKSKLNTAIEYMKQNKGKSALGIIAVLFVVLKLFGGKKEEE